MAVPASLFIQPIVVRTQSISSPQRQVFPAQVNFSRIESILVVNIMDIPIFVSIYVSTDNFMIIPPTQIQPKSTLELLNGSYFSLITGETLLASSDDYQNLFNINVEGKSFKEVV